MTDTDPSLSGAMAPMKQREEDKKGSDVGFTSKRARKRQMRRKMKEKVGKRHKITKTKIPRGFKLFQFDDPAEARYTVSGRLRHANPYMFEYIAAAKRRWFGRELLEIYSTEFLAYTKEYYKKAIETGRITVNGEKVPTNYLLTNGDKIKHTVHRHEPPICSDEIKVCFEDDDVVVVSKPSSLPMHPCGRYRHNSLLYILGKERKQGLHMVHRLDRLTSGLVVLAKRPEVAARLSKEIREGGVAKTYLARVRGCFPEKGKDEDKTVIVKAPIACADKRIGRQVCGPAAEEVARKETEKRQGQTELKREKWEQILKPSETHFQRVDYDGCTSLVKCMPKTGRTHQIRVHLQHLGYPIANDPCYGGSLFESNALPPYGGLPAKEDGSNVDADEKSGGKEIGISRARQGEGRGIPITRKIPAELELLIEMKDDLCGECKSGSYWTNPRRHCSHIWLHALSYTKQPQPHITEGTGVGVGWSFNVPRPIWAEEGFDSKLACSSPLEHDPNFLLRER